MIDYIKPEAKLNFILNNAKGLKNLEIEKILIDEDIKVGESFFKSVVNSVHPAIWLAAAHQKFSFEEFNNLVNSVFSHNFKKLYYYLFNSIDPKITIEALTSSDLEKWKEFLDTKDLVLNIVNFLNNASFKKLNKKYLAQLFAPVSKIDPIFNYIYQVNKDPYADYDYLILLIASELNTEENVFLLKLLLSAFHNADLPVPEYWLKHFDIKKRSTR